ncbi:hypothetical protein Glove_117g202 [Diversispora epigaea]|uniref:BTB domain-containing protein n=1 Tax=Diversispora epigaea TaxID=1348612 RepID=A0A397J0R1_9GLOM|nr:hypothetical protein Glove_117g202 [Diversispora epigaea]
MALKFYENLSNNFIKLLENGDEHNIIIEVGERPAMQTFKVHSTVLCYRCPYLYDELKKSTINNDDNIRIVQKPLISAKVFNVIIKYIYGATVNLENVESSDIFDILMTAKQFQFEELVIRLQTFLIESHPSWLKFNFSKIYHSSFQTNNFKALQNFCNDIIVKHPNLIFESDDFGILPEAALVSVIQRDDLQLEESKVWDYVIQWGTSQNKNLPLNLDDWIEKDFQILKNTLQHSLQNFCNDIIVKHPNLIFESDDFGILPEAALVSVIQRDDLQLEESKVWDYVIQWGTSQNKNLPLNLDDWIEKDFQILKNTLQHCLPHIRYFQFSNEHVVQKIHPYQQILSKKLMTDILKYYISPNQLISSTILPPRNIFQIPSSIISYEHATEIASWIDKKEVTSEINKNPYDFNLILRGSRDGFGKDVFWNLCDQKTNIVVVAKVKDTDEIVGGYNPIGWNSNFMNQHSETNDSFIFSLKNRNIKNSILSRVIEARHAIFNNPSYGPNFRCNFYMKRNQLFRIDFNIGYEKLIRKTTGEIPIDDYEVFQISTRKNS